MGPAVLCGAWRCQKDAAWLASARTPAIVWQSVQLSPQPVHDNHCNRRYNRHCNRHYNPKYNSHCNRHCNNRCNQHCIYGNRIDDTIPARNSQSSRRRTCLARPPLLLGASSPLREVTPLQRPYPRNGHAVGDAETDSGCARHVPAYTVSDAATTNQGLHARTRAHACNARAHALQGMNKREEVPVCTSSSPLGAPSPLARLPAATPSPSERSSLR